MADKNLKSFFLYILMLFSFSFLSANSADQMISEDDEIKPEDNWQILKWEKNGNEVYKHRIVIQKYNRKKNSWSTERILTADGESDSIKIVPALDLGYYRYMIYTVNVIGIEDGGSDWMEFKIYKAYTPKISGITVDVNKSSTFYLDENNDGYFTVKGKNFFDLKKDEKDISYTQYALVNATNPKLEYILIPEKINGEKEAVFKLDLNNFELGLYYLILTDASGLKSKINSDCELWIKYRKSLDIDVGGGYSSSVIAFDGVIKENFGTSFFPVFGMTKISCMPLKKRRYYNGFGSEIFYGRLNSKNKEYDVSGNEISMYANYVFQKPFYNHKKKELKGILELRCGIGLSALMGIKFNYSNEYESKSLNSINPSFLMGVSYQHYVTGRMYIEPCVDFTVTKAADMVMGAFRPAILLGWQF